MNGIKIKIICAMARNGVIGNDNELPWKDREEYKWDLKHFRETTLNKVIIMGYNTFISLNNKPLKKRLNIVISHNEEIDNKLNEDNLIFVGSLERAIEYIKSLNKYDEVYIIGGVKTFECALINDYVDEIILTVFDKEFQGNKYFPLHLTHGFDAKNKQNGPIVKDQKEPNGYIVTALKMQK